MHLPLLIYSWAQKCRFIELNTSKVWAAVGGWHSLHKSNPERWGSPTPLWLGGWLHLSGTLGGGGPSDIFVMWILQTLETQITNNMFVDIKRESIFIRNQTWQSESLCNSSPDSTIWDKREWVKSVCTRYNSLLACNYGDWTHHSAVICCCTTFFQLAIK